MLGAIPPVGAGVQGLDGGSFVTTSPVPELAGSFDRAGVTAPGRANWSSDTAALAQVLSGVAELLQDVGGDLKNDKMVQMLVALLILLALLHGTSGEDTADRDALEALGSRGGAGRYTSTTIITLEQTTTTLSFYSAEQYSAGTGSDAGASVGGTMDLLA
jgi:hypothetical protein